MIKSTKGLISREFNEGIQLKRFWSCFKSKTEYQEQIRKFFLPQHENDATFSCFSTFQILSYGVSKHTEANPCGFIQESSEGPLNKSAKFHRNTLNQMAEALI